MHKVLFAATTTALKGGIPNAPCTHRGIAANADKTAAVAHNAATCARQMAWAAVMTFQW